MSERDYVISKAFRQMGVEKSIPNPARMKELNERAFQRAAASRAAGSKPGFRPRADSVEGKAKTQAQLSARRMVDPHNYKQRYI
jgi:hypothetical protein